jgi:hypothetical protein
MMECGDKPHAGAGDGARPAVRAQSPEEDTLGAAATA